uniref:Integrase catalytic domain-containing protein n=1 Tax=Tanacetum cinerariifolium TaxID=118510 RepID=A0A6L2NQI1_TANCI|nr:hypothetical protein [Tanacetum cinerariifolium]
MYPGQPVGIGASLPTRIKQELRRILCENKDIFAWSPSDMIGIPRELTEHKLNVHHRIFPVLQKKRVLAKDQNKAITAEVTKLVKAKALQRPEMNYPVLKKLALALVHTARRLRRYFQAHAICMLIDQPIRQVLLRPGNSGRLAKWAIRRTKNNLDGSNHQLPEGQTSSEDPVIAKKISVKAPQYSIKEEAHFGSCGAHAGARTIAQKVAQLGYFWPTMYSEATKIIKACINCQQRAPIIRKPQCDIWVETAPLATITGNNILKFVWNNIVCRFGIPGIIVSDNGKQFAENPFHDWRNELNIKQQFTPIAHPQVNGQTEITNRTLIQGLKMRLEAVLPPEIGLPTNRVHSYDEHQNSKDLRLNLDLLEERRDLTALREARYKQHKEKYYNSKVCHAYLKVRDFVLRKNEASQQEGQRKLDPNWEGPYQIIDAKRPGTYVLRDLNGKLVSRT